MGRFHQRSIAKAVFPMKIFASNIKGIGLGCALLSAALLHSQSLPFEPALEAGQSITGAYEGWFANPDGSFSMLAGYFNRNTRQSLDIPIGPENSIQPGGPDYGQPTH